MRLEELTSEESLEFSLEEHFGEVQVASLMCQVLQMVVYMVLNTSKCKLFCRKPKALQD